MLSDVGNQPEPRLGRVPLPGLAQLNPLPTNLHLEDRPGVHLLQLSNVERNT